MVTSQIAFFLMKIDTRFPVTNVSYVTNVSICDLQSCMLLTLFH